MKSKLLAQVYVQFLIIKKWNLSFLIEWIIEFKYEVDYKKNSMQ
jgi:hypothetical protein